jgi:hypothetical protein
MINWKTSKEDLNIIGNIIMRAREEGVNRDSLSLMMDIEATHEHCPLRLKEFFEAPKFDFIHDIIGIINNLNKDTGELENCFLPRYAQ